MFYGLLEELLCESVASPDRITQAIDNHSKILITYRPITKGHEHATGTRLIGIFAYGQTKASNDCVRIYEYAGDTASFTPGWKTLRLDQFLTWKDTNQRYFEPPDKKFNPNGDKTMSIVYKIAKFDDDYSFNNSDSGPKTAEDVFLTDTEKKLQKQGKRIKNQFENPIYASDFKTREGTKDYKKGRDEYTEGPKTAENTGIGQKGGEETKSDWRQEIANKYQPLKDKIANAPKIELDDKNNPKPQKEEEPEWKRDITQQYDKLKDKIQNAQKIDLSQFDTDKQKYFKKKETLKEMAQKIEEPLKLITISEIIRIIS